MISFPINPASGGMPAIENKIMDKHPAIKGCDLYKPDKSLIDVCS